MYAGDGRTVEAQSTKTGIVNSSVNMGNAVWSGGPTASGAMPLQGKTVAMAGVPFGTQLIINGQIYTVEDRGTPYGHVDIYLNSHQGAVNFGLQSADVYLVR